MNQTIGWLGNFCFIAGAYAMARKKPLQYAVYNFFGNACYCSQSIFLENWSLLGLSLILGVLNVVTLWRWK